MMDHCFARGSIFKKKACDAGRNSADLLVCFLFGAPSHQTWTAEPTKFEVRLFELPYAYASISSY